MSSIQQVVLKRIIPIIFALALLTVVLLWEKVYTSLWIFAYAVGLVLVIGNIYFIITRIKKDKITIFISIAGLAISGLTSWVISSETFKSKILIEAHLIGDLSAIQLKLRENGKFESIPITFLGPSESFKGEYKIENDNIIFFDRPYDSDFIPDTVKIVNDKIILEFDKFGNPDTTFANYFEIKLNYNR